MNPWPVEIQVSIIGAIFAVVGYVGKGIVDWIQNKRKSHAETVARLEKLHWLLYASGTVFLLQQEQIKTLRAMLETNHPSEVAGGGPFEDVMTRCYKVMNDKERPLHGIIRATTENSVRSLNKAMSGWLESDSQFKSGLIVTKRRRQLATQLFLLEVHLLLWRAKYKTWIPGHPEHAVVYLADENAHGLGFPVQQKVEINGTITTKPGVQAEVDFALGDLRTNKALEYWRAFLAFIDGKEIKK
jgi:hypothetical protein